MDKSLTVREPITIETGETKRTYYIRELGYLEFDELEKTVRGAAPDKERAGIAVLNATVIASVEEEDGTAAFTAETWKCVRKEVFFKIGKAAMKMQGLDVDSAREKELTEEEAAGNAEPSRKSGTKSPFSSAAPSENSSTG
jgi:hypothetical protein